MTDTLTTVTNLINSPPGQLVAGGVLAGIVWKFFERVEAVLNEDTKLEIAVWLVGVDVGQRVASWPGTFVTVLDRFFGDKPISWRCFRRSCIVTYVVSILLLPVVFFFQFPQSIAKNLVSHCSRIIVRINGS